MRAITWLLLASSFILLPSSFLLADGGTIQFSQQKGSYRITVFTSPNPLRAGPVDFSVLVQEAATGKLASPVQVAITTVRRQSSDARQRYAATTEAATNKLYYAAAVDLPEPGWYAVEVSIEGPLGQVQVGFDVEAAEPASAWLTTWPWFVWPVLPILLFSVHQVLVRRRNPQNIIAQEPRTQ